METHCTRHHVRIEPLLWLRLWLPRLHTWSARKATGWTTRSRRISWARWCSRRNTSTRHRRHWRPSSKWRLTSHHYNTNRSILLLIIVIISNDNDYYELSKQCDLLGGPGGPDGAAACVNPAFGADEIPPPGPG